MSEARAPLALGPVSSALEAEVRTRVRRHGVVVLAYDVQAFRGSYIELMIALEDFNEESVKQTPFYELYRAGVRFRKGLDTLVTEAATGQVRPEAIAAQTSRADLSLEGADHRGHGRPWVARHILTSRALRESPVKREGLCSWPHVNRNEDVESLRSKRLDDDIPRRCRSATSTLDSTLCCAMRGPPSRRRATTR